MGTGSDRREFDLASVLARDRASFDPAGRFFEIVQQDPVLSGVKLIAHYPHQAHVCRGRKAERERQASLYQVHGITCRFI